MLHWTYAKGNKYIGKSGTLWPVARGLEYYLEIPQKRIDKLKAPAVVEINLNYDSPLTIST